ncbi:CBS domain-containing protein [Halopelagius longus]|uniref:CBS domain-containing protein n=1 Tax=Halopelagius longus TaxID=1236180 RepID=A0A1H0YE48_9EURY|nr:CBS domain-containing protein [Halopelagius longus]RDI72434.1 CBS domain-containing protein [Halopelagius longus]SDQ13382.1 IMP dehydrogenase [Halopelagius longus]
MPPTEFDDVSVDAYMTETVATARPEDRVADVVERLRTGSRDRGLPVLDDDGRLAGFVGAIDLLGVPDDEPLRAVMRRNVAIARPGMSLKDAAGILFRTGHRFLPVVDDDETFLGVVSNADVVRSQIERTTPSKVERTRKMLETTHGVSVGIGDAVVAISELIPTQREVFADELEGRAYELEHGLAEPLITLDYGEETLLVDGHHRALAARELDIGEMRAYVLVVDPSDVPELGLRKVARIGGLDSLADVRVNEEGHHPVVELIGLGA